MNETQQNVLVEGKIKISALGRVLATASTKFY